MSQTAVNQPKAKFFCPCLTLGAKDAYFLDSSGEIKTLPYKKAALTIRGDGPLLVCHIPYTRQKLGLNDLRAYDILELYAFVYPVRFATPTPSGIAKALGLPPADDPSDTPMLMLDCVEALLDDLSKLPKQDRLQNIARAMGMNGKGWAWTRPVLEALGATYNEAEIINSSRALLNIWNDLPEWTEAPPEPPPSHFPVSGDEVRQRLHEILLSKPNAEKRPEQANYATRLAEAFAPIETPDHPTVVLAEAGTGIGKTLGYLAPSTLWAEKNDGSVWISTYTKNLQRQISTEIKRLYPDKDLRDRKVTIRKGRENYVCLLNFEDFAASIATTRSIGHAISAGLMARWIMDTEDGDLSGAQFHGWLPGLMEQSTTLGLADKRGECIFSACDHYHRCFGEHAIRKSARTPIVIANHAIVMIKAAHHDDDLPRHVVFDEGHHIFDAADSTFCAELTGVEMHDLRRWIIGPEGARKSRARGLKKRLQDLIENDQTSLKLMEDAVHHARFLPEHDWLKRIQSSTVQTNAELFLAAVEATTKARATGDEGPYSIETGLYPAPQALKAQAADLLEHIKRLRSPVERLSARLKQKISEETETLSTDNRKRLEAVAASLDRRINTMLTPWVNLLKDITEEKNDPRFVDWMEIGKLEKTIFDIGLHRHFIDPSEPLAQSLKSHAHSVIFTSATLRDGAQEDWTSAETMTGSRFMDDQPIRFSIPSPYNYAEQTRVFVVTDVTKTDMEQLASAYRTLFEAAGGGALGIFTSIARLRSVHHKIAGPLGEAGLKLYAQHIDGIDTGTLVDMFRDDTHSCLLGTDAVRDGVDVPGESLRMIVFDRVPWPRATILQKERRKHFGGKDFDERQTRLKLKQAYGRLIRTASDKGVFVMLDSATPSRLLTSFPEGVTVERLGIAEALRKSREFLQS